MKHAISCLVAILIAMALNCGGVAEMEYPIQIVENDYQGPECWLLCEPQIIVDEAIYEVYAPIDRGSTEWKEQVKEVISLCWSQYNEYSDILIKVYSGTEGVNQTQPTYNEILAVWERQPFSIITESVPTIIWYPNGAGINAETESEVWET